MSYPPPPQPSQSTPQPAASAAMHSPDGRWYWNGQQWQPVAAPGPSWARPYGSADGRAAAALSLVALAGAGLFVQAGARVLDLLVVLFSFQGSAFETAATVVLLLALLVLAIGAIGSAITVPIWTHRAYSNLPALGEEHLRWSPAWAAGAWFIPFGNAVLPLLVVLDVWNRTASDLRARWWLVGLWWTAAVASLAIFVLLLGAGYFLNPLNVVVRLGDDLVGGFADVAGIAAGLLLILIIRRVTDRQSARYAQLQEVGRA